MADLGKQLKIAVEDMDTQKVSYLRRDIQLVSDKNAEGTDWNLEYLMLQSVWVIRLMADNIQIRFEE